MKAGILTIGHEVLSGFVVNTNASYLGAQLSQAGVEVQGVWVVTDSRDDMKRGIEQALAVSDVVIITGGLGPTEDDMTRDVLAEVMGVDLQFDEKQCERIEAIFKNYGRAMKENNKRQAYCPKGAKLLDNDRGTAPGIRAEFEGKLIYVFPGVPSELKEMFARDALPEISNINKDIQVVTKKIKCFGEGESNIADMIADFCKRGRNPEVNFTCSLDGTTVHITAKGVSQQEAAGLAEADEAAIRQKLGSIVFGQEDKSLPHVVGAMLKEKGLSIATAESCTGGFLSKLITDVPGSSEYFKYGWVTYSNEAKIRMLGVDADLIEEKGAVSEEVALAMASGAMDYSGADVVIAITGIAGPGGGSEAKPVGLVYISIAGYWGSITKRCVFRGDRTSRREFSANYALNMVRLALEN